LSGLRVWYFSHHRYRLEESCLCGPGAFSMRFVGFVLLLAGWFLVLSAIALLAAPALRASFVLAGIGVEALGLALVVRSHLIPREEKG
jgi:hypothetical protein